MAISGGICTNVSPLFAAVGAGKNGLAKPKQGSGSAHIQRMPESLGAPEKLLVAAIFCAILVLIIYAAMQ
jgi:hypothetical protein